MTFLSARTTTLLVVVSVFCSYMPTATGFGIPQPIFASKAVAVAVANSASTFMTTLLSPENKYILSNAYIGNDLGMNNIHHAIIVGDESSAPYSLMYSSLLEADGAIIFEIVRNIAIAITAVLFGLAGLTVLTASVLIPAAAKELEKECLELAPDLWEEYQGKLEPGQTMAQRPDLMQELGAELQPLLDAKIAASLAKQEQRRQEGEAWTDSPSVDLSVLTNQWDDNNSSSSKNRNVVDAEIVASSSDSSNTRSADGSSSSSSRSDSGSDSSSSDSK